MELAKADQRFTVIRDPIVAARLTELDCPREDIESAVMAGIEVIKARTDFNPKSAIGIVLWDTMTRVFREKRCTAESQTDGRISGWEPLSINNWEATLHPNGRMAVAIAQADLSDKARPIFDRPKESVAQKAILQNYSLNCTPMSFADMDGVEEWSDILSDESECFETRYILIDLKNLAEGVVRVELALPLRTNSAGRVTAWGERIAFTIDIENDDPEPKSHVFAEVDVPVSEAV